MEDIAPLFAQRGEVGAYGAEGLGASFGHAEAFARFQQHFAKRNLEMKLGRPVNVLLQSWPHKTGQGDNW